MYEPIIKEVEMARDMQVEHDAINIICKMGINIDKERLIQALEYDRSQYEKGFQDAKRIYKKTGRWILIASGHSETCWSCEHCGAIIRDRGEPPAYCEACGSHNTLI